MWFMLDTNTASYVIKGHIPAVRERLRQAPAHRVCVSSITAAELLRGAAKKPEAVQLPGLIQAFLARVEVFPWREEEAMAYAELSTLIESNGKSLGSMDMLIASHCYAIEATLVTNDKAFKQIDSFLKVEDWSN